uniref:Uncharacterized protein LOC105059039 isoform X2 n=1 Tax=Elaeis guineensis var. tenera TaxID=51953 RepID=A0A6I9SAM7_ELAGV|nr:uncharacterized protein LOC105059039 isoform X2 [Elaeis guineensis]
MRSILMSNQHQLPKMNLFSLIQAEVNIPSLHLFLLLQVYKVIGIIKRKALIKELADAYHNECLAYCQELLQLQRKWEEQQYIERKTPEDARKQVVTKPKPSKRPKKRL